MYYVVLTVHILVCIFLIIVVLLQSGKAADLAGAFGGMGSQTAFGPRGSATLLSKATTISAVVFMITSLSLSIMATRNAGLGSTVLETAPTSNSAPANKNTNTKTTIPVPGQPAGAAVPAQPVTPPPNSKSIPLNLPAPPPSQPAPAKK
jgi:preprotein translocase subunit SecG